MFGWTVLNAVIDAIESGGGSSMLDDRLMVKTVRSMRDGQA